MSGAKQLCDHFYAGPNGCEECRELEREYPEDAPCAVCERMTPKEQLRKFDGYCGWCEGEAQAHAEWESHEFGDN